MNLAGVKRILALQAELDRLREEIRETERDVERLQRKAVEERRRHTDLVPLESTRLLPWRA